MATPTPPFFNSFPLAVNPIVVKNISIRKSFKTPSKLKLKAPVLCPINKSIENITPPTTGAGIKNLSRKATLFLTSLPSKRTIIAIASVSAILKFSVNIIFPPYNILLF